MEQQKYFASQPPRVRGGKVVIPKGLLVAKQAAVAPNGSAPTGFAEDPVARREIELLAMEAVMAAERALGNAPSDVSAQKIGYDVLVNPPHSLSRRVESEASWGRLKV